MIIPKVFEIKKEKDPEQLKQKEIGEYLATIEAIDEAAWLEEKKKLESYRYVAKKILELLPQEVKVFELSADIYAIRDVVDNQKIEDESIKDLDWARKYSNGKAKK